MQANVLRQWTTPDALVPQRRALIVGGQQQFNYDGDRTDLQGELCGQRHAPQLHGASAAFVINQPAVLVRRACDARRRRGRATSAATTSISAQPQRRLARAASRAGTPGSARGDRATTAGAASGYADARHQAARERAAQPRAVVLARASSRSSSSRTSADPTATPFGGARNVFARIDQHTLSMNTRINATVSPTLTLELFAQPFLASGHYAELQAVRGAAHDRRAGVRARRRDGRRRRATPTAGITSATASIRTARARRRRSPSAIRTSTCARCAARRSCAGSTGRARRSSSCGRSSARAARTRATSTSPATARRCSATGR